MQERDLVIRLPPYALVIAGKRRLDEEREGATNSARRQAEPALVIRHTSYKPKATIEAQDGSF